MSACGYATGDGERMSALEMRLCDRRDGEGVEEGVVVSYRGHA
jgi:hypothetical protein